jgi:hypothetical protein
MGGASVLVLSQHLAFGFQFGTILDRAAVIISVQVLDKDKLHIMEYQGDSQE